MRVNAATKKATRERILDAGRRLFLERGYDETTTRDLARAAGVATGTLFNYFASKDDMAAELLDAALHRAERRIAERRPRSGAADPAAARSRSALEEDLFARIAADLRALRPLRSLVPSVIDRCLSPSRAAAGGGANPYGNLRARHLEAAGETIQEHLGADALGPVVEQVYWSLYAGVLSFWSADGSHRQEDTLALLDASVNMFVDWLRKSAYSSGGGPGTLEDASERPRAPRQT